MQDCSIIVATYLEPKVATAITRALSDYRNGTLARTLWLSTVPLASGRGPSACYRPRVLPSPRGIGRCNAGLLKFAATNLPELVTLRVSAGENTRYHTCGNHQRIDSILHKLH